MKHELNMMIKNIVRNSYFGAHGHIPSALSMVNYVYQVCKVIDKDNTNIVIGKVFGALAYYEVWKSLGWIGNDVHTSELKPILRDKTSNDGFDFVDFAEETMGNSLGVACGYAQTSDKFTWVNLSDAALQMGGTLEAILSVSKLSKNGAALLITVDLNGSQVTGDTEDVMSINPVISMLESSNIDVVHYNAASGESEMFYLRQLIEHAQNPNTPAKCILFHTKKGYPVKRFMENPSKYHYHVLDEHEYDEINEELINVNA